jgi:adhesin transport system outer membrane protein
MGGKPVAQTEAYARNEFSVKTSADGAYVERDPRQKAGVPMDLLAPLQ